MAKKYLHPLIALAAALCLAGCGKTPEGSVAPLTSAAAPENFAREAPDAGKVDYEVRTLTGEGRTLQLAVKNALLPFVMETNGVSIASGSAEVEASLDAYLNDKTLKAGANAYVDLSTSHTEGKVQGFRIVSQQKNEKSGLHIVSIEIRTPKFVRPDAATLPSVAIAAFRTSSGTFMIDRTSVASADVVSQIRQHLVNALTKSGRVSVLDREFEGETGSELQRISVGNVPEADLARLGQNIATDYVLVGSIDRFGYDRHERAMQSGNRTIVNHSGGATLSLRVINVATGHIEQSDSIAIELPTTQPTTLGTSVDVKDIVAKLTGGLSEQASAKVITHLFPVSVVDLDGDEVVLSQGGDTLTAGKHYRIVARGKELKDPQTGKSLGRREKPCCVVLVTSVEEKLSYGKLVTKDIDVAAAFAPGALELRGVVDVPGSAVAAAPPPSAKAVAASAKSDDWDDDKEW